MISKSPPQRKIAIAIPTLDGGGAERSMVQLANGLASRGLNVELVVALHDSGPYKEEISGDVPLVVLNARHLRYLPVALHKYMTQNRPDIVVTALMNNLALLMKKVMRYPAKMIISERVHFSRHYCHCRKTLLDRGVVWASRRLYPTADRIVAVSKGVADDLAAQGLASKDQLRTIYNPVINDGFNSMLTGQPDTPLLRLGCANYVAVGRFAEQKDYPTLLNAFARVRRKIPAQLLILGDGKLRGELEALAVELGVQEDVLLPGFIQNPFPYIAGADCFVLSSLYEGLPGVLIQALGCGTSVVATDCPGGSAEILDNGKYGTLVPVGDADALAEGMNRALLRPFPANVLKQRAEMFSEERCIAEYINLFKELMGDKGL